MTGPILIILDLLLLLLLCSLAWGALRGKDLRQEILYFIAFGLLLALAWVRLKAPDVALAEAAIGAGLAGALLLASISHHNPDNSNKRRTQVINANPFTNKLKWLITSLTAILTIIIAWSMYTALALAPHDALLIGVQANIENSGVSNPVTAVLLNFRAYDTLLELAVLLAALLGILSIGIPREQYLPAGIVFTGLSHWLAPLLILTAAYLLWVGAHAPGGAFQAGAILAAAGVLLRLAGQNHISLPQGKTLATLISLGLGVFVIVGSAMILMDRAFLQYPVELAGILILVIETAAMISIAATLILAFIGGRETEIRRPS